MIGVNRAGADWIAIRRWADDQIAQAVATIVTEGVDERHSDTLRGRVAALYALIEAVEPDKLPDVETPNYG